MADKNLAPLKDLSTLEDYREAAHFWQEKWDKTNKELQELKRLAALPTNAAREAAEPEAPAWFWKYLLDPNSEHAERMQKLLDDSTAALRREVEALKAERDAARRSLTLGQLANGGLRVQLAKVTEERDDLKLLITGSEGEIFGELLKLRQKLAAIDAAGGTEG